MSGMKMVSAVAAAVGVIFAGPFILQADENHPAATMPAMHSETQSVAVPSVADVDAAIAAVELAKKAIAANDLKAAQAALNKAMSILDAIKKAMTVAVSKSPFVNAYCPIMGSKIDPNKTPDSLAREYKGMKVAFCCPVCPPQWDKLSDAEKDAKLKAAMEKK